MSCHMTFHCVGACDEKATFMSSHSWPDFCKGHPFQRGMRQTLEAAENRLEEVSGQLAIAHEDVRSCQARKAGRSGRIADLRLRYWTKITCKGLLTWP